MDQVRAEPRAQGLRREGHRGLQGAAAVHMGGSDTREVPRVASEEPTHLLVAGVGVTHARTQARHGRSRLGMSAVGHR